MGIRGWAALLLAVGWQGLSQAERRGDFATKALPTLKIPDTSLNIAYPKKLKVTEGKFTDTSLGERTVTIAARHLPGASSANETKLLFVKPPIGMTFRSAFLPATRGDRSMAAYLAGLGYTLVHLGSPEAGWRRDSFPKSAEQFGLSNALLADREILIQLGNAGLLPSGYEMLAIGGSVFEGLNAASLSTLSPSKFYLLDPMPVVHEIDAVRHRVAKQAHAYYRGMGREYGQYTINWLGADRSSFVRQKQSPEGREPNATLSNRETFLQQLGQGPLNDIFPLYRTYFAVGKTPEGFRHLRYTPHSVLEQMFDGVNNSLVATEKLKDIYAVVAGLSAAQGGYDLPWSKITQPVHIVSANSGHGASQLIGPNLLQHAKNRQVTEQSIPDLGHMDLLYNDTYWPRLLPQLDAVLHQ